ncbi:AMP-binding protein [Micrococcus luteus]|uniref:AMP-binding protein n=1 Tax=Micrococcus luteus TaxID=1270 RepID=UPI000FD65B8B|nr:AMP-binding protein [Micrococcus luteus]MCT2065930.1 AMP-binding protein [Micrococcus luteus]MCV7699372.1 AMP-binding protein [Micrococcus luteus]RZB21860.1 hypothetical protein EU554_07225 [Micrococcus luteus]
MLPNVPAFVAVYEALMPLGAVMVPLTPLFTARELEYFLEDSGAHALGHARAAGRAPGARPFLLGHPPGYFHLLARTY